MFDDVILLSISLVVLAIGLIRWRNSNYLLIWGKKAQAIIFKNNYSPGGKDGTGVYMPVVRFLNDKQEWITQELSVGYNPPLEEGSQLEVIYDPDEPANVEIRSSFHLEVLPRILVAIGIAGLIVGILDLLEVIQVFD